MGLQSNREEGANAECDLMFHCRSKSRGRGRPSLYVANGRKWRETKIRERHSRTAEAREGEGYFFQFNGILKQMGSKGEGERGRKRVQYRNGNCHRAQRQLGVMYYFSHTYLATDF